MMTGADIEAMRADMDAIRSDNAFDLVLRRGETTLAAQRARVAGGSTSARVAGGSTSARVAGVQIDERAAAVVLLGDVAMDVQIGDRFTLHEVMFQVTFVRPDRRAATMVSAQAVE